MDGPQDVITDRILDMLVPGKTSSNSTINVHHDGKATWWAVTVCIVMATMNIGLAFLYVDLRREQARIEDYQQTTFMLVPDLKKLVDEELQRRKGAGK